MNNFTPEELLILLEAMQTYNLQSPIDNAAHIVEYKICNMLVNYKEVKHNDGN